MSIPLPKDPIRIAHIVGKMKSGGVESVVMNYFRNIDRTKVQFDFIIDEDSTIVPYDEIESLGGRVYKIPPYQKPIAYHKKLVRLFSENKYCIVHSHINTLSVFPLFAAKRAGVPVRIAHVHSTAGKGELSRNIVKYALRPFSRLFPTHFLTNSDYAGRWLFGNRLYNSGKVKLVKNAIDLSKFAFDLQVRQSVREAFSVKDKFVLGHVGRFMKQKNHSFLIDIFEQIRLQEPESVLLLVGEGELKTEIQDKVDKLKLSDYVHFLGVRDDVHKFFQAMDAFLFPSLYEGLGIVAIEAQAAGLKVVASDMVPEEAKITDDVIFIPLRQPAEKWAEIILDSSSRDRAAPTEQLVAAGYDIVATAEKLIEIYFNFLERI